MKRILSAIAVIAVIALLGTAITMRSVSDVPERWHVDPAVAERTGKPNDFLMAPDGAATAPADAVSPVFQMSPEDLLFLFDSVARPSRNVATIAGSVKDLHITYVQRSRVIGFPDYISVKAVQLSDGAALIIWSRSRYGHSDLGANRTRIETWMAQIAQ